MTAATATDTTYETIRYETDGPVLTITLNRPEKLNAYTAQMGAELADAILRADEEIGRAHV